MEIIKLSRARSFSCCFEEIKSLHSHRVSIKGLYRCRPTSLSITTLATLVDASCASLKAHPKQLCEHLLLRRQEAKLARPALLFFFSKHDPAYSTYVSTHSCGYICIHTRTQKNVL